MSDRLTVACALACAAACLAGAAALMPAIDARRAQLGLTLDPERLRDVPPQIALTQATLGSFRGLAVDYFWARATRMQDEGKFYEAMELANWITVLQPHYGTVWEFQAWNMAYNISDAVRTPEEKYLWVQNGIRLLRERGIPANPRAVNLYVQLAHLFFHKVGKYAVGAHWHYKRELAAEWHELLGPPVQGGVQAELGFFQALADAPRDLEALRLSQPAAAAELDALKGIGLDLDLGGLRHLGRVAVWSVLDPEIRDALLARVPDQASAARDRKLLDWLAGAQAEPRRRALAFWRAQVLRRVYRMEPRSMLGLVERYGPIDWRHPAAQSLYWASEGARIAEAYPREDLEFERVNASRYELHSLQALAFTGRLNFEPMTGYYSQGPDPRLFDAFELALTEASRREGTPESVPETFAQEHRGFLTWAVEQAYLYGREGQAAGYYEKLRTVYGPKYPRNYVAPLEEFVVRTMTRGQDVIENVLPALNGLANRAILEGWAQGRPEVAARLLGLAQRQIHQRFMDRYAKGAQIQRGAQDLPPFPDLVADVLAKVLLSPALDMPVKARIWHSAPIWALQRVYDRTFKGLREQAAAAGWDGVRAFFEPPGMDAFRKSRPSAAPPEPESQGPKIDRD
ncbi:MAG: hypothetical protein M5U26_09005 [Planctomycetota bacterium]|nr:hypothetical protein [Planctomycetota bacterium]